MVNVVIHDETIDRTTNGKGRKPILSIGTETQIGKGQRIPTLSEVLNLINQNAR
jgi:glycerophosphoryl diester phosphodiesterase